MKTFDEWMLTTHGETLEQALQFSIWQESVTIAARLVADYARYLATGPFGDDEDPDHVPF